VATEGKRKRVRTLVFSRVVGYYQPVTNWNIGKQQEYKDRAIYDVSEARKAAVSHD
jgi:ribonucleoside-triphosphate reductase